MFEIIQEWLWRALLTASQGWTGGAVGYTACGLVLVTFTMKSMRPLRLVAILSNVAFIDYAYGEHIMPILILHSILLPLNIVRLAQGEIGLARTSRESGLDKSGGGRSGDARLEPAEPKTPETGGWGGGDSAGPAWRPPFDLLRRSAGSRDIHPSHLRAGTYVPAIGE
jgi:hypothetical protein